MTATESVAAATPTRGRALNITLWVVQAVLGVFFVAAAAVPKLAGQQYAVEMFGQIGAGQWLRYLVGVLELAGGIGLLVPRLSGLAAAGLAAIMVGAFLTQVFVLGALALAVTPVLVGVVLGLITWGRWPQTKALAGQLTR